MRHYLFPITYLVFVVFLKADIFQKQQKRLFIRAMVVYVDPVAVRKTWNMNKLFAVDFDTEEIIVSDSPNRSNNINFVERIERKNSEILNRCCHFNKY